MPMPASPGPSSSAAPQGLLTGVTDGGMAPDRTYEHQMTFSEGSSATGPGATSRALPCRHEGRHPRRILTSG